MFGGDPDRPPPTMAPRSRQYAVMAGILATFVGLAAMLQLVPVTPPQFPGDVATLAVGTLGLFVGGILLGFGVGARRPRTR